MLGIKLEKNKVTFANIYSDEFIVVNLKRASKKRKGPKIY